MDKQTLSTMAADAFSKLAHARENLFSAAELAITHKAELETAKYGALMAGVIDGKNAEIREAQLKDHLEAYYAKLDTAERAERKTRYEFDRAGIDVDTVKTMLRIAELS